MLARGRILAVQERRFRLKTLTGQVYLLTLARGVGLETAALHELRDRRTEVEVVFSGQPNMADGVAHAMHTAVDR